MFGFGKKKTQSTGQPTPGPPTVRISTRLCTDKFNGKYPHVGLYDCRARKVWLAKPLAGQAIRTSHARLITGAENATSTVWKDRFLCFWFYTPNTGEGLVQGYPIDWTEAHLQVRIDPNWDYDRQAYIAPEFTDHIEANLERQARHGERILEFFRSCKLPYPVSLHLLGQQTTDSRFYAIRVEAYKK